jgi:hypothetical protein
MSIDTDQTIRLKGHDMYMLCKIVVCQCPRDSKHQASSASRLSITYYTRNNRELSGYIQAEQNE